MCLRLRTTARVKATAEGGERGRVLQRDGRRDAGDARQPGAHRRPAHQGAALPALPVAPPVARAPHTPTPALTTTIIRPCEL